MHLYQTAKQYVPELFRLALPIMVSQVLQIATSVLDTIMAGQSGAADLAGVGVGGSIWIPMILFFIGILSILTAMVAQSAGSGQQSDIPGHTYTAVSLCLLFLPLGFATGPLSQQIFSWMEVDAAIAPVAGGYFHALLWGLPALLLFNVVRFYSDGLGFTRPAMFASILGLAINAPLNYLLIFGKAGLPALGGVGCGWASTISFWAMLLFMLGWIRFRPEYGNCRLRLKNWQIRGNDLLRFLKIGIPVGISYLSESSVFCIIALFLSSFGAVQIASHQIALNLASLSFMIPMSMGLALTIQTGRYIGRRMPEQARQAGITGLSIAAAAGTLNAALFISGNIFLASLYSDQVTVIHLASDLLVLAGIFQISDSVQTACSGILRGYKDTRVPMFFTLLAFWGVCLPLGYWLGMTGDQPWAAKGFWTGLITGLTIVATLNTGRFLFISRTRESV